MQHEGEDSCAVWLCSVTNRRRSTLRAGESGNRSGNTEIPMSAGMSLADIDAAGS